MPNNKNNKSKQTTKSTKSGKQKSGAQGSTNGAQRQVAVAYGGSIRQRAPTMRSQNGSMVVVHREYVADITSAATTAFNAIQLPINPGMSTFPWLSTIAKNFEKYRIKKLTYHFESLVGSITPGSVMLAIDMDAADALPSSKAQMLQSQNAARCNVWATCQTRLPEAAKQLYNRSSALASSQDIKTYDVGNLTVATQGVTPASTVVGELWVDYEIELAIPQASS